MDFSDNYIGSLSSLLEHEPGVAEAAGRPKVVLEHGPGSQTAKMVAAESDAEPTELRRRKVRHSAGLFSEFIAHDASQVRVKYVVEVTRRTQA